MNIFEKALFEQRSWSTTENYKSMLLRTHTHVHTHMYIHTFCVFSIGLIYDSAKMLLLFILKESGGMQNEAVTLGGSGVKKVSWEFSL